MATKTPAGKGIQNNRYFPSAHICFDFWYDTMALRQSNRNDLCTSAIWACQLRNWICKLQRYNRNILQCCSLGRFKDIVHVTAFCIFYSSKMLSANLAWCQRRRNAICKCDARVVKLLSSCATSKPGNRTSKVAERDLKYLYFSSGSHCKSGSNPFNYFEELLVTVSWFIWPVGLMDKASASGAGDSRFESWAGVLGWAQEG